MSGDATRLQSIYLQFLQNQIDRTSRAYRRSSNGDYGFDDWFRDWTECAADVVGTAWGPVKDILDTQARWRLNAKPGATNVMKAFRCNIPEGTALGTTPLQSDGKADIEFTAHVDADGRSVIVHIGDVGEVPAGTAYVGAILDPAAAKTVASLTLTIAEA